MSVSFTEVLELVGRLDDQPGFDSPRERLRRYLTQAVTEFDQVRALVDEGQHALGEQSHRALQDIVAILGRFLGFETAFGAYHPVDGSPRHHGLWRSRRRLNVVLHVFTDQTPRGDFEDASKELPPVGSDLIADSDLPVLGLAVVTPMCAWRTRLEQMMDAQLDAEDRRVVSADCLVTLATLVNEGDISHEEVLQLLQSSRQIDLVAGLLLRVRRMESPELSRAGRRGPVEAIGRGPRSLE